MERASGLSGRRPHSRVAGDPGESRPSLRASEGVVTFKSTEILNKLPGAGLLIASIAFATHMNMPAYALPALAFGAGGFWLVVRREKRGGAELEVLQRLDQLSEAVAATQHELTSTQERLDRLSDERDFMRQLTVPPVSVARPAIAPGDLETAAATGPTPAAAGPRLPAGPGAEGAC
jgi:uncharacterized coiled-coil protein SlyX